MTYYGEAPATDGDYTVVKFLQSGDFVTPDEVTEASAVLIVGGGGGGNIGKTGTYLSAGGGAGRVRSESAVALSGTMGVVVGAGGASQDYTHIDENGNVGGDSSFAGYTAEGGAGGRYSDGKGGSCGGGAYVGGNPNGICCGGGGGAGGNGGNASSPNGGNGGIGVQSGITGATLYYGGGGGAGGSADNNYLKGTGTNGGGNGCQGTTDGVAGAVNTGSGGGGGAKTDSSHGLLSGAGGTGIVIIRYLTPAYYALMEASGTIELSGSADLYNPGVEPLEASGTIALSGSADLTIVTLMQASGTVELGGEAWLTVREHGEDTLSASGLIQLGGWARLTTGESLPPTDTDGWTVPGVEVPDIRQYLRVLLNGAPVKLAQIADLVIELDIEGGPVSASMTLKRDLKSEPRIMHDVLVVWYKDDEEPRFRGRLEHLAAAVDDATGYTLTLAGPLVTLQDHKAFRTVYVDSDLQNWRTDQGPRTAPDTFEVSGRSW